MKYEEKNMAKDKDAAAGDTIITHSVAETIALGEKLGALCGGDDLMALIGDLGTGKTHLIKGMSHSLEIEAGQDVTSPTFTLVNEYEGRLHLVHIDAYRLEGSDQLEVLGFDDMIQPDAVVVVEWADRVWELVAQFDPVVIRLSHVSANERKIKFENLPEEWRKILLPACG